MFGYKMRFLFLVGIILFMAFLRLIPHPPNFTPLGAMALYGTTIFNKKWHGLVVSLFALFLSDLFLGLHTTMFYVYASFGLIAVLGIYLKKNFNGKKLAACSLIGSFLFYLITNFGMWLHYDFYPHTANGLLLCYIAGLPYLFNTLAGDMLYNFVFFGASLFFLKKMNWMPDHLALLPQRS